MSRLTTAYERLLNQFQNRPKWLAFLAVLFARMQDSDDMIVELATKRHIDTAEGIWLNQVGEIIGLVRPEAFESDDYIFTYKDIGDPDDVDKAFATVPATTGGKYQDALGGLTIDGVPMADDDYRQAIKGKAWTTGKFGSLKNITLFCREVFGFEADVTSPITGFVLVTPREYITAQQKWLTELLAPLIAGVTIRVEYFDIS